MATAVYTPTASQQASSLKHLDRRAEWRFVRHNGVRYVVLPSGVSGRTYWTQADASSCSCPWNVKTATACAHMIAVRSEIERARRPLASEAEIDLHLGGVRAEHDARQEAARAYFRVFGGME